MTYKFKILFTIFLLHFSSKIFAISPPSATLDQKKLENYAQQQARTVANRVVSSFGAQENYKYNFIKGLKQGYASAKIFSPVSSNYNQGYIAGKIEGKSKGQKIGRDYAYKEANTRAQESAISRHKLAISTGFVDYNVRIPSNVFVASRIANEVFDLEKHLQEKVRLIDSDLRVELKKNTFGKDFVVDFQFDNNFSLSRWISLDGKYKYVDSYFADDHAFNEWKGNGLGGSYDYHLYKKMTNSEKIAFEQHFKKIYRNVINEKLENRIQKTNNAALLRGIFWGTKIGNDEAYLNGFKTGLETKIEKHASKSFNQLFPDYFNSFFMHWMHYFDSNLAFDIEAQLIPSQKQAGLFSISGKIINYSGAIDINLPLNLTSTVLNQTQPLRIAGIYPHSIEKFELEDILQIKDKILPNKNYEVILKIGSQKKALLLNINFTYLLEQFSSFDESNSQNILKTSILNTIKSEWDNNHSTFDEDIYQASISNLNRSYLGQLILFTQNNNCPQLNYLYHEISKLNRSGSWLHFNKNKSFLNLLEKLKI